MILTCPECATSYFVDDSKIPEAGREVRCASCGSRWHASHQTAVAKAAPEPAPEPAPVIEPPVLRQAPKRDALPSAFRAKAEAKKNVKAAAATGAVWAGMGVIAVLLVGALYFLRLDVVRIWPKAASAYAAVHVPVNPLGLTFEEVGARPALKDGHAALIVTGKIRNTRDKAIESPPLRIELLDKSGKRIAVQNADPENPLIPPGEARHFTVSLLDPPLAAEDANVEFALDRKVAKKAPAAAAAQPVSLRGPITAAPAPPVASESTPAAPIEAKPLPPQSPHAIAPGNG